MKVQQATHRQHGNPGCRHPSISRSSCSHGYARNPSRMQAPMTPSVCHLLVQQDLERLGSACGESSSEHPPRSSAIPMRQHHQHRGYPQHPLHAAAGVVMSAAGGASVILKAISLNNEYRSFVTPASISTLRCSAQRLTI